MSKIVDFKRFFEFVDFKANSNGELMQTLILLILLTLGCTADVRPDRLEDVSVPSATDVQTAQTLLAEMRAHHGAEAWLRHGVYKVEMVDTWKGLLAKAVNPWPDNPLHGEFVNEVNRFTSRVEILSGDEKGIVWELRKGVGYAGPVGKEERSDDEDLLFILAAMQYLMELPMRTKTMGVVAYGGKETLDGKSYEIVMGSWESLEPSDSDQYVLYLDPETKRLDRAFFTIRDQGGFFKAGIYYDDYREVGGALVPFRLTIRNSVEGSVEKFLHQAVIKSFSFQSQHSATKSLLPK